jgi:hypothetical protein
MSRTKIHPPVASKEEKEDPSPLPHLWIYLAFGLLGAAFLKFLDGGKKQTPT